MCVCTLHILNFFSKSTTQFHGRPSSKNKYTTLKTYHHPRRAALLLTVTHTRARIVHVLAGIFLIFK